MVSKYGKDFVVPAEFPTLLKSFTREVLRSQPANIYEFGATYFEELQQLRDAGEGGGGAPQRLKQLTPEEIKEVMLNLFKNADADGSNTLSLAEFKALLYQTDLGLSNREMARLLQEADVNDDGVIDYSEFLPLAIDLIQGMYAREDAAAEADQMESEAMQQAMEYMLHGMKKEQLEGLIKEVFRKADVNGDGHLTMQEFHKCIKEADLGLKRREINALMHRVDADEDGKVTYEEFAPLCFEILTEIMKEELLQARKPASDFEQAMMAVYGSLDADGSGKLSKEKLTEGLRQCDFGLSGLQIHTILMDTGGGEDEEEASEAVDYAKFAPLAAEIIYRLLDPNTQMVKVKALETA